MRIPVLVLLILLLTAPLLLGSEPTPTMPPFALLLAWAGPEAASLRFNKERVQAFLAARQTDLAAGRQPEWSAWLKGLEGTKNPSLRAWALARRVEAGDLTAYQGLQASITEHLLGISKPGSGRSDRIITNPPSVAKVMMPDALSIDHGSGFWRSLRKTLMAAPDRKLDAGLYSVWCFGTHPDQRDLILELAEHVEAIPGIQNMQADPWNDPRFWIVLDWAMAWGTREDFAAIHAALKPGAPKWAFDRVARPMDGIQGFFTATRPAVANPAPANTAALLEILAKEEPMHFDFSQMKVLEQPPAPRYPEEAKLRKMMTHLVLTIVVDPEGRPVSCRPSPGPWLGFFAPTGVAYGMRWRFKAPELNGVPQYARFRLTMPFRLRN
jgi:hypothetical protein